VSELPDQQPAELTDASAGAQASGPLLRRTMQACLPWQTLIGAIAGFAGVCLTIYFTVHNSRLDDLRRQQNELAALRRGLYTELSLMDALASGAVQDAKNEGTDKPVAFGSVDRNLLYRASLSKLTDLTPDEVAAVYQAHDVAAMADANSATTFPPEGVGILVARSASQKAAMVTMMNSVHEAVSSAMKSLYVHMRH
jgi:hypothetical protein